MQLNITNEHAMRRCLELALNGIGQVSPNLLVGALIINNGEIISEGWHKKYGQAHAEIEAMQNSDLSSFDGMTLFVNLEPCSHQGKQPPCVESIISGKFSRVVIGMKDPNPLVAGSGINQLRQAGIEVITGVLEEDCKWINRFFYKYMTQKIPYVTMKVAMSLDACIATNSGESKWITCHESRRRSHVLRSESDAILVGIGTVLKDDPMLTVRFAEGRHPSVIVLDSDLRTPLDSNLVKSAASRKVFIVHSKSNTHAEQILQDAGIKLIKITTEYNSQKINLKNLLSKLATEENIISVLVEGGAGIFSSFIADDLVDELHIFSAPVIIGDGLKAFNSLNTRLLSESKKIKFASCVTSDVDLHTLMLRDAK